MVTAPVEPTLDTIDQAEVTQSRRRSYRAKEVVEGPGPVSRSVAMGADNRESGGVAEDRAGTMLATPAYRRGVYTLYMVYTPDNTLAVTMAVSGINIANILSDH